MATQATKAVIAVRRAQAEAALNLSRVQRLVERRLEALLLEHRLRQVTPSQANALMILFQEKQALTARALASQMRLSEVTVGRFVRSLEHAGWILRTPHPSDARAILLAPSPKAYRAFDRFLLVSNSLLECAFQEISSAEIATLSKLAQRMSSNLTFHPQQSKKLSTPPVSETPNHRVDSPAMRKERDLSRSAKSGSEQARKTKPRSSTKRPIASSALR